MKKGEREVFKLEAAMSYYANLVEHKLKSGEEITDQLLALLDKATSDYSKAMTPYMKLKDMV